MAWVGIGCGGLLVIAVIGISLVVGFFKRKVNEFQEEFANNPEKAAAEMIVGMNPDLEMVIDDETAGEMTVRVKSSGEEITVSYADIAEGRFTVTDGSGTTTSIGAVDESKIPAWVPRYPNIADQKSVFHQDKPDGVEGVWMFSTHDTTEQIEAFFDAETSWSTSSGGSSMSINGAQQQELDYSGDGRVLKIIAASSGGGGPTQVTLNYKETTP
ncbi:hypothetical protein [Haloferula sp. A504]|uniref:hypothetical protein n=1 Tax=Haloferula sp. A504 TaxID=3373601 RepID=UPI0031BF18A7|nr:hypothetical protein [Verrucomicrobiaceae bacterium E54]